MRYAHRSSNEEFEDPIPAPISRRRKPCATKTVMMQGTGGAISDPFHQNACEDDSLRLSTNYPEVVTNYPEVVINYPEVVDT